MNVTIPGGRATHHTLVISLCRSFAVNPASKYEYSC